MRRRSTWTGRARATIGLALASAALLAACGGEESSETADRVTVRLVTHDSFALSEDLVAAFEAESGLTLEIIAGGDAGEMVNRAVLSAGNPDADVLFGIDTTLLSRALDADVFDPYVADADLRPGLAELGADTVTAVDDGDVCVNVDDAWFDERGIEAPRTLDDLADPRYRDLLVVQNPATSSPGLAFLLATIARYGDGWRDYWRSLRDNGVLVVNGWSEAYLAEFSGGGGGGDRPLVVSYSTSPPAEIVYASDPKPERPSTSSMVDGCYRQVEFAGVLRGTPQPDAARAVVDWLVSPAVQADIPLTMFVFPALRDVPLPPEFTDFVTRPAAPLELTPIEIEDGREAWIEEWTAIVLR